MTAFPRYPDDINVFSFLKKWTNPGLFLFIFVFSTQHKSISIDISIDCVPGTRTQGGRMEVTDEST